MPKGSSLVQNLSLLSRNGIVDIVACAFWCKNHVSLARKSPGPNCHCLLDVLALVVNELDELVREVQQLSEFTFTNMQIFEK